LARGAPTRIPEPRPKTRISTAPAVLHGAAERQAFGADGDGIVWAVLDSGIDRQHPHFRQHANLSLELHRDFTAPSLDESLSVIEALVDRLGHGTHSAGLIAGELARSDHLSLQAEFKIPGDPDNRVDYSTVPGAAGVAPLCKLVSLRVLDDQGNGEASTVLSALQWVRTVNERAGRLVIHGVNMGLGYEFDAELFACGQSPVCVEANRLVQSGVVVVAAAGNTGYGMANAAARPTHVGIPVSINDPGNAELVITVGSVPQLDPLERGVSYFSAKGPTMDGREKPDLVAPGERMLSCVSGAPRSGAPERRGVQAARYAQYTGTAQATAYVSGAIAALLSVRPALIGQPLTVKRLLMATADDLKRDRYFQGRGLLNLTKALLESADPVRLASIAAEPKAARDRMVVTSDAVASSQLTSPESAQAPRAAPLEVHPGKRFAVALSYAGENRDYVKKVLAELRRTLDRDEIFYDRYYESEIVGPNMDVRLQRIYHDDTELIAVFISAEYESKQWTGLEWRAMRDIIKRRRDEDILPLRFDDTDVPGLFSIDGYIDLRQRDPENVADLILERLALNRKKVATQD
jgi:subtilisin family serine protease